MIEAKYSIFYTMNFFMLLAFLLGTVLFPGGAIKLEHVIITMIAGLIYEAAINISYMFANRK